MKDILNKYLPPAAVTPVILLIESHGVHLKIVNARKSRHGDYRLLPDGKHQITVNGSLNPYRFLLTLIHEIAHLVAFKEYGNNIKPHGVEWKVTFRNLMLPFLRPEIYPRDVLPVLAAHFKNPKASSDRDAALSVALQNYDPPTDKNYIFELPLGAIFMTDNGKVFQLGNKRRKRYECLETATGNLYLFQPNAKVLLIKN